MSPAGSYHPSPYSSPRERLRKVDEVEDDKQSTLSHSSGVPRADQGKDALRLVAGNRVRHARCAPEFLEEIADKGIPDSLRKATSKKFKFITGSDARTFFKNYIIQYHKKELKSLRNVNETITNQELPAPIVFAVSVWDAGSKCVDYHMTWRGYSKADQSPEFEAKVNRFDKDFKRLARVLDKESRHLSSLRTYRSLSGKSERKTHSSPQSHKSRPPPGITVFTPDEPEEKPNAQLDPSLPKPPSSAADSVMSLPLLNMVRGVPFSHRLPLRVTNPDRLSMLSQISIVPGKLPEELSLPKSVNQANKEASNNNLADAVHSKSSRRGINDETIKRSSDSIRSSDTKSSKSSRSSRSSSRSENRSSRNPSPGDGENSRHSSRRRKDSSKDEEPPEFLIVLLGDKLDIDIHSWHGLERQTSIRSVPAERHSPWIGPLASQENPYGYHQTYYNTHDDSESDLSEQEQEQWKNIPVIPMKPLMEAMGLIPNMAYYSPPVVPGGLQYHHAVSNAVSNAGSPQSNSSPYLYSSPRLDSSPYVPSWLPQLPVPSNATSVTSRPPSRAYTSASYASPYMQSHTGPF